MFDDMLKLLISIFSGLPFSCLLLISSALCVQIETVRSPRVIVEEVEKTCSVVSKLKIKTVCFSAQANEWDFDSASALNRFDHHGYSRSSLMEQFLKERQKQQQSEDFDYDLKFLHYSAQARFACLKVAHIGFNVSDLK